MVKTAQRIRVGVGGWTYEPWRDNFYPKGLPHSRELEYASGKLSSIEINGTYYSTQKRESFAKWRDETPDDFVFSLKASRYATNRKALGTAGESIERFVDSGIAELGPKLGPIVWQFMPTKRFEPEDFAAFLALLPSSVEGVPLRHVVDVRHDTFKSPQFVDLARRHGVATVYTDSDEYPAIADVTADFVYARLMLTETDERTGYPDGALDGWADAFKTWAGGDQPDGVPLVGAASTKSRAKARDVFVYFISGAKERNPAAAMALIERVR